MACNRQRTCVLEHWDCPKKIRWLIILLYLCIFKVLARVIGSSSYNLFPRNYWKRPYLHLRVHICIPKKTGGGLDTSTYEMHAHVTHVGACDICVQCTMRTKMCVGSFMPSCGDAYSSTNNTTLSLQDYIDQHIQHALNCNR